MGNFAPQLILALFVITFLQSGYDKIADWKGNIGWLKGHFKDTFLANNVPAALFIILILEIISGLLCGIGIVELALNNNSIFGKYGAILSSVTLLMLLFGQRLAKDYDGARTIVIYFIPAVIGVFFLS